MSTTNRRWRFPFAGALIPVAFFAWRSLPASSAPVAEFKTLTLERADLRVSISATGTVEPEEVVDVGAQVAGMIRQVGQDPQDSSKSIDDGTSVEQGTVLARIDESLSRAAINRSRARVQQANAAVQQAEAQGVEAEANVRRGEADVEQLQARLFLAEREFSRAENLRKRSEGAISPSDFDSADLPVSVHSPPTPKTSPSTPNSSHHIPASHSLTSSSVEHIHQRART